MTLTTPHIRVKNTRQFHPPPSKHTCECIRQPSISGGLMLQVIRTHDVPKNPYITLCLHTILGSDYYVPLSRVLRRVRRDIIIPVSTQHNQHKSPQHARPKRHSLTHHPPSLAFQLVTKRDSTRKNKTKLDLNNRVRRVTNTLYKLTSSKATPP